MQSQEAACDEGECVVKRLKTLRTALQSLVSPKEEPQQSSSHVDEPSRFDIFEELQKLQDEDETDSSCDDDDDEDIGNTHYRSLILERLVKRDKLNTIILNLHPDNKGYSLVIGAHNCKSMCVKENCRKVIRAKGMGYKEEMLLRYLSNEEIPPFIMEALDKYEFLFYNGCVIAEVRNYRQAHPDSKFYVHHVLLRPTQKTILADVNLLTRTNSELRSEDRDAIESEIVMAHAPDLCLDPDPDLEDRMTAIYNRARVWNDHPFRKMARRATQVAANRKRKLDQFTHRHGLDLLEFCRAKTRRMSTTKNHNNNTSNKANCKNETKTVIPAPHLAVPKLCPPSQPVVINQFRSMPWSDWSKDQDCSLHLLEEYTLETDVITSQDNDRPGLLYRIKLSIFQWPLNMEFVGELYLQRNCEKGQVSGVSCRFPLGSTRTGVHNYICQFNDIFTECGRKNYRMTNRLVSIGYDVIPGAEPPNANTLRFMQNLQYVEMHPMVHLRRLNLALQAQNQQVQNQTHHPVVNRVIQGLQPVQIQANVQTSNIQLSNVANAQQLTREMEVDAIATNLEISSQQAVEKARRQQAAQQQKILSNSNIISLLNSSLASNANSDASAAVVNAINSAVAPQQRLLSRKMMLSNAQLVGARVLSHGNFIALNNHNRVNLQEVNVQRGNAAAQTVTLSTGNAATRVNLGTLNAQVSAGQTQTVTLTPVVSGTGGTYTYTTIPIKQQVVHQRASPHQDTSNESALGVLLAGTPSSDRPELASPNQSNSLLLEKLAADSSGGAQNLFAPTPKAPQATAQFLVQSSKANTVISPMSSPPPQTSNTLNVQSLNLTQLQGISGFQFQLQNFTQPIQTLSSSGQLTGAPASQALVMSLPRAQPQQGLVSQGSSAQGVVMNAGSGNVGSSQLAHLVSTGAVKNINHQLATGTPQFQLISQLQSQSRQQNLQGQTARTLQRTPITIKMAPNANQTGLETVQHYQQLCITPQKGLEGVFDRLRRSGNEQP